jgi:hypothetical protein
LGGADVLVFIDEDPAEAGQQVALRVGILWRQAAPFEQRRGFAQDGIEVVIACAWRSAKLAPTRRMASAWQVSTVTPWASLPIAHAGDGGFPARPAVVGQRHDGPRFSRRMRMR